MVALADGPLPTIPGGQLVDQTVDEVATVTDITLIDPPQVPIRGTIPFKHEQLVEGHTVFETIDIPLFRNVTNFTFDILGNLSCETHTGGGGVFFLGVIPVPDHVSEVHEECHAAGVVVVTPNPFDDPNNFTNPVQTHAMNFRPTSNRIPFTTPDGQQGEAVEYLADINATDWMGVDHVQTVYAWATPVMQPWTDDSGATKMWYCPLPEDRLADMGIHDFTATYERDYPGDPTQV